LEQAGNKILGIAQGVDGDNLDSLSSEEKMGLGMLANSANGTSSQPGDAAMRIGASGAAEVILEEVDNEFGIGASGSENAERGITAYLSGDQHDLAVMGSQYQGQGTGSLGAQLADLNDDDAQALKKMTGGYETARVLGSVGGQNQETLSYIQEGNEAVFESALGVYDAENDETYQDMGMTGSFNGFAGGVTAASSSVRGLDDAGRQSLESLRAEGNVGERSARGINAARRRALGGTGGTRSVESEARTSEIEDTRGNDLSAA